jgi:alpha-tubulin suppressor-like RCC1 family protein
MTRPLSLLALTALAVIACNDSTAPNAANLGRRIVAGERVGCGLDRDGTVYCWGENSNFYDYGTSIATTIGGNTPSKAYVPKLVHLSRGLGTHFCGLKANSDAVCWGRNNFGELGGGVPTTATGDTAMVVAGGHHWTDIAVGRLTTCGITVDRDAYCWGFNQRGEIGDSAVGVGDTARTPHLLPGFKFSQIAVGWLHACGITTTGDAYCWGDNVNGELGIGATDTVRHRSPAKVTGGLTFVQLSLGSLYTCGLTTVGDAYCWGANYTGQLGDGTQTDRAVPTRVAGGIQFQQIVTSSGFRDGAYVGAPTNAQGGASHTCALGKDSHAYCWGWGGNGELGDGTTADRSSPVAVIDGRTFQSLVVGGAYSCGMLDNGIWCWGSNYYGQIGTGSGLAILLRPQPVGAPFDKP